MVPVAAVCMGCTHDNINPPARGATTCDRRTSSTGLLQSTLPHGERLWINVEMHEPEMLQSTLPHGERRWTTASCSASSMLQSTLPHGERPRRLGPAGSTQGASIHAPARRATRESMTASCCVMALQSTLPCGERQEQQCPRPLKNMLQSTLPHGERLRSFRKFSIFMCFNPRSRTGSDMPAPAFSGTRKASIHAPARGATDAVAKSAAQGRLQSTLPHGERRLRRAWML